MAIFGTVVIEDQAITFQVIGDRQQEVYYTVAMDGEEESRTVDARAFMIALGAALDFDGGEWHPESVQAQKESVQPANPDLRFIP